MTRSPHHQAGPGPACCPSDRQARPLPPGASSSLASAAVLTATTASPSYPPGASPWRTCRRGQRACQPARPTGYINRARGLDHSAPSSLGLRLRVAWARRGTAGGRRARGAAAARSPGGETTPPARRYILDKRPMRASMARGAAAMAATAGMLLLLAATAAAAVDGGWRGPAAGVPLPPR